MQFKIFNTEVKISFTFFSLILLLFCFNKEKVLLQTVLFSVLHEIGHLIALRIFKVEIEAFSLSLFGGNISRKTLNSTKYLQDVLIYFSGPFLNLFLYIIFILFYNNSDFYLYKELATVNLFICLFNLLPFYSFDGGKILLSVFKIFFSEKASEAIVTAASFVVAVPFTAFTITLFLKNPGNFHLVILSMFMLLSLILKK